MQGEKKQLTVGAKFRRILLCMLGSAICGTIIGILLIVFYPEKDKTSNGSAYSVADNGYSGNSTQKLVSPIVLDDTLHSVAEEAQKTVVTVMSMVGQETVLGPQTATGIGSGVIYSMDQTEVCIMTNAHVIEGATKVYLYFDPGISIPAEVQGTDVDADLAVIKVQAGDIPEDKLKEMQPAEWGDSDALRTGDVCMVVGCPYSMEFEDSVTLGIIGGTEREISYDGKTMTVMQTDAAINPGNSGGAVVDKEGHLIGISSAKVQMDSVEGICFFIPAAAAKPVLDELVKKGSIDHPSLGIDSFDIISEAMAEIYEVPVGLIIYEISPGTKAYAAGLQTSDIITEIDGTPIHELSDLDTILDSHKIGDVVELTVVRGPDYDHTFAVKLELVSSKGQEEGSGSFFENP